MNAHQKIREAHGLGEVGSSGWFQRHAKHVRGFSATDRTVDLLNIAFEVAAQDFPMGTPNSAVGWDSTQM